MDALLSAMFLKILNGILDRATLAITIALPVARAKERPVRPEAATLGRFGDPFEMLGLLELSFAAIRASIMGVKVADRLHVGHNEGVVYMPHEGVVVGLIG